MESESALNVKNENNAMASVPISMCGISDDQYAGLTRLTMTLYCLPFSDEFRQPVHVRYPDLLKAYLEVIRVPSDLGTILIKLKNRIYKSVEECGRDLKLCFKNAIQFNPDLSNLVAMSNHLLSFAENLWNEIIETPFSQMSKKDYDVELFRSHVRNNRVKHFQETIALPMTKTDIRFLHSRLETIQNCGDTLFGDALESIITSCSKFLSDDNVPLYPCLIQLISPISDVMKKDFGIDTAQSQDGSKAGASSDISFPCFMNALNPAENSFPEALSLTTNAFLQKFESVLGEMVAILFERCTRGCEMSSIWAKYNRVVWAQPSSGQPNKRAAWWPGVVIAGAGISPVQEEINVSRIPKVLKSALNKLRPKSKEFLSQNGSFVGTSQLSLVEYFGTHDFGWCKTEVLIPYEKGEKIKLSVEKKDAGFSESITKDINAIEEADSSFSYMESVLDYAYYEPEVGFLDTLEENIANLPQSVVAFASSNNANNDDNESVASKPKGQKRKKKADATSFQQTETAPSVSFSYTMYPSKLDELSVAKNKRKFALLKTVELCRYARLKFPLIPSPMFRGKNNAMKGKQKSNFAADQPNLTNDTQVDSPRESDIGNRLVYATNHANEVSGSLSQESKDSNVKKSEKGSGVKSSSEKKESKYTPKMLTFAGQTFAASIGCTQVVRNKHQSFVPVLHTRKIEHDAPVFFLEASSCEKRKEILREEITKLKSELEKMSEWVDFADQINAKKQKDKSSRSNSAGTGKSKVDILSKSKIKNVKGDESRKFKRGMLASSNTRTLLEDDETSAPSDKKKDLKETKAKTVFGRGKAQLLKDGLKSNDSVMSPLSSNKRKRNDNHAEESSINNSEISKKTKPARSARTGATPPKPFKGFTTVMNMMPSI